MNAAAKYALIALVMKSGPAMASTWGWYLAARQEGKSNPAVNKVTDAYLLGVLAGLRTLPLWIGGRRPYRSRRDSSPLRSAERRARQCAASHGRHHRRRLAA